MKKVSDKIIISGGVLLVLMFIHLVTIIDNCTNQVTNNTPTISAFTG